MAVPSMFGAAIFLPRAYDARFPFWDLRSQKKNGPLSRMPMSRRNPVWNSPIVFTAK